MSPITPEIRSETQAYRVLGHSPTEQVKKFRDLVRSRRVNSQGDSDTSTTTCATLSRLILRLCNFDYVSFKANQPFLVESMARIQEALHSFAGSELELSFEITNNSLKWFPNPTGRHWDEDQNATEKFWEFTTSMPPARQQ